MTSAEEVETISEKLEVIIYLDDNPKISDLLETTATLLRAAAAAYEAISAGKWSDGK